MTPRRGGIRYSHDPEKRKDNVLRETQQGKALLCGHFATSNPVAIYPGGRKLYDCPRGCGLQKAKR